MLQATHLFFFKSEGDALRDDTNWDSRHYRPTVNPLDGHTTPSLLVHYIKGKEQPKRET